MRVLHVLDHSLPLHSGYTFRSRNIIDAQRNHGWEPVAVTSPKHEANWPKLTRHVERVEGTRYFRSGRVGKVFSPLFEILIMRRLYLRICEAIREQMPRVLHAHSPILNGLPTLWAGRKFGLPVVYEIRAFWEDAAVDHGTYKRKSLRYRSVAALESYVCRRADQIAVICEGLKKDLVGRGIDPDKITRVPNAADLDGFLDCESATDLAAGWGIEGKPVIGFIGSFYDYEGLDLLIDAFADIACKDPNLVLLLVGGGRMEASLRAQVETHGLEDRVVFTGRIPHERVAGVYNLMDFTVLPRYSMRLTDLVTPLKPLEAMATKTPCLASDVGGHEELIHDGETGFLFPAGDRAALADAILDLRRRKDDVRRAGERGRDWVVRERNWEATGARYVAIYDKATTAQQT